MQSYVLFHVNADYSSIDDDELDALVSDCYQEILNHQASLDLPIAIEMSGSTAVKLSGVSPSLIEEIRDRSDAGGVRLVSGGMHQIIAPLVPAEVTLRNHERGIQVFRDIFGIAPDLVLPSELAISDGSLGVLEQAGYRAAFVDLDNFGYSTDRFAPSRFPGRLEIIWASSSIYQWVQHYIHGDITLDEILKRIEKRLHFFGGKVLFPLYSGDAETFGFRPGRYLYEGKTEKQLEWARFATLIEQLRTRMDFDFTTDFQRSNASQNSELPVQGPSVAREPVRVKKQPKYNVARWAVSGRGDFELNAHCWKTFENLKSNPTSTDQEWDTLLRHWSSDFRTHVTSKKWLNLSQELVSQPVEKCSPAVPASRDGSKPILEVLDESRFLSVSTHEFLIILDKNRGLSIAEVRRRNGNAEKIFGSVAHGTFLRPELSPDWYSGNLTLQVPGQQQVTDLSRCQVKLESDGTRVEASTAIGLPHGVLSKRVSVDLITSAIDVEYTLPTLQRDGSLRLGYISMLRSNDSGLPITYSTHNGGFSPEEYSLTDEEFAMGDPVNHLVSARTGIGMTGGWIHFHRADIGDQFLLRFEQGNNPYLGLLSNNAGPEGALTRFCLSALERDDTLVPGVFETKKLGFTILPGAPRPRS